MGKRASLTAAQNLVSTPGFKPQTVQPIASRYTHVTKAYRGSRGIAHSNVSIRWTPAVNFKPDALIP